MRGAVIDGTLHGRSFTRVDPGAKIAKGRQVAEGVKDVMKTAPPEEWPGQVGTCPISKEIRPIRRGLA
jgi:hypothetical protein